MTSADSDLFVCGGGVVGLSIAWLAAQRGWTVTLADARQIGRGASWAGAGILPASPSTGNQDPLEQLRALSHQLHPEWAKQLKSLTGIDNGFQSCGGVSIARSAGEFATLIAQQSWWDDYGVPFERFTPQETTHRFPCLADSSRPILGSWYIPTECQLRNPHHLKALRSACERSGRVRILEHCPVIDWQRSDRWIQAALTPQGAIQAKRYCVTAGAWSQRLLEPLGLHSGILPIRGQMILYRFPTRRWIPILNEGHRYLVPRADGHVLAGSCEEEVGFEETTTDTMLEQLRQWSQSLVKELADAEEVQSWAGLRPGSFDSHPYLGRLPDTDNGFIASGHFRHGLHLSPGTAQVMIDLMQEGKTSIDLESFRFTRGKAFTRPSPA